MSKKMPHSPMGQRGVTRPMAMDLHSEDHHPRMTEEDRMAMLRAHHRKTLWVYWSLVILGIWMLISPLTFDYARDIVSLPGGRSIWIGRAARAAVLEWSDILSGLVLIICGIRSLRPNRPVSLWLACGVGVWLSAAPLIFWAPNAMVYVNDTLVGMMVIALTILIPGMPNMIHYMEMGPQIPQGWSYNPSSWAQRSILIALGFAGWVVSRYLAAFQLGYIDSVWDPFFGDGSRRVLSSRMSESWPVSDAGLGALAYTFEFLMGWMGGPGRWRTMPWMVALFGILVIPLGLVHIFLVVSQPVMVGSWCTMCLLAAALMLPMIPLEVDEVVAMIQFMRQSLRRGERFWKVFWKGGTAEGDAKDERTPPMARFARQPGTILKASLWGMSFPWELIAVAVLGAIIMACPGLFGSVKAFANICHIGGALLLTIAVIAMGETLRAARYLNVWVGLSVGAAVWFVGDASFIEKMVACMAALMSAPLSIPRGEIKESFGSWDKYVNWHL